MEGVQILNQFEVVTKEVFSLDNFLIGLGIGAAIGLIAAAILFGLSECEWSTFLCTALILIPIIAVFVGALGGAIGMKPVAWETHYEVTINEEVNMQEFMEKYEIIETRGSIYTVKEK